MKLLLKMPPKMLKRLELPRVVPVQEPNHHIWDLFHDQVYIQDQNLDPEEDEEFVIEKILGKKILKLKSWKQWLQNTKKNLASKGFFETF